MYQTLLSCHSLFRWLVLSSLLLAIYKAYTGYFHNRTFSTNDNVLRHGTATIAHTQLVIGIILYVKSPIILYFWGNLDQAIHYLDASFFALYHFLLMLSSVVLITIGSALAKRKPTHKEKFKTILISFGISLLLIFIAIPWPFSPLANRAYFRPFGL